MRVHRQERTTHTTQTGIACAAECALMSSERGASTPGPLFAPLMACGDCDGPRLVAREVKVAVARGDIE